MDEKLQKRLANAGYGSRRQMEAWIQQGLIKVNGKIASLGDRVQSHDKISVKGKPIRESKQTSCQVISYYKPEGEICTRQDPEGRKTLFDNLSPPSDGRWIAVGRLDINTSGLILLTNNGTLAHRLMHPSHEVEREYAVRVLGEVSREKLKRLQQGVRLDDGFASFDSISDAGGKGLNHWYHVTLREGRNREVRRLWAAVGITVSRLMRIRYGPISLPRRLTKAKWVDLNEQEINSLLSMVGLDDIPKSPATKKPQKIKYRRR